MVNVTVIGLAVAALSKADRFSYNLQIGVAVDRDDLTTTIASLQHKPRTTEEWLHRNELVAQLNENEPYVAIALHVPLWFMTDGYTTAIDAAGFLALNKNEPQCAVPCVWRYVRDHLKGADSFLADMLVMVDAWEVGAFAKAFASQRTAFFGAEAWHTTEYIHTSYPWIDVYIAPDETSDVPTSYNLFNYSTLYHLDGNPPPQDAASLAVWIHSYGNAWRNTMADQITALVHIDFLGPWRNNGNDQLMYPECAYHPTGVRHRTNPCIYRHYKFVFATENAEVPDYTTEKYWYAIAAGAIPIVNGAPNAKDWMPPHSAIYTKDFNDNGTAIAEHILAVAANETAYAEYHAWRTDGQYHEPFERKILMSERNMACNICIEGVRLRLIDRHAGTYRRSSDLDQYSFNMAALDHLRYDADKGSQIA
jgi:Glycosyltransferase family 10 (fucosyltransferase) C-term